jgi:hypothetical protein
MYEKGAPSGSVLFCAVFFLYVNPIFPYILKRENKFWEQGKK